MFSFFSTANSFLHMTENKSMESFSLLRKFLLKIFLAQRPNSFEKFFSQLLDQTILTRIKVSHWRRWWLLWYPCDFSLTLGSISQEKCCWTENSRVPNRVLLAKCYWCVCMHSVSEISPWGFKNLLSLILSFWHQEFACLIKWTWDICLPIFLLKNM